MEISNNRKKVFERIRKLELAGIFDLDVEDDPTTVPLDPSRVDYTGKKLSTRVGTWVANRIGRSFYEKKIRQIRKNRRAGRT